jgi:hypothetical protein
LFIGSFYNIFFRILVRVIWRATVKVKLVRVWQEILVAKYGAVNVLMEIAKTLLEWAVIWTKLEVGTF